MEYAVETFSLTKVFSDWWGRSKVCAVDELNLQIRHNEVFGLLGPNGSGKTTTLKMLLGLLYPTSGKSIVLGGEGTDPKINARIGFLPEESYLYKYLTARETLDFYGSLFGLNRRVRKMRIESLLEMVGLKAVANRAVGTFSKGMARRIGLAQALINDPDLLILDEPTTGLDPIGTRQIKDLVIELVKRGKTVLLCSHLLADVEDICDRIAILYGGRIQAEGKVRDLLQQTNKKQITISDISNTAIEQIKQIVHAEQADCEITSPMDRLETFFIRTVTAAQQQAQTTSGAVSTTQIGDFLTSKSAAETQRNRILDKLVATPLSKSVLAEPTKPEPVKPIEEDKPDEQLLSELTKQSESVEVKPVISNEQTQPEPTETQSESAEEVRKNVLDDLTDSTSADKTEEQTGNHQGESDDA